MPDNNKVPRQYLDNATLEQATELASLYLTMDSRVSFSYIFLDFFGFLFFLNFVSF